MVNTGKKRRLQETYSESFQGEEIILDSNDEEDEGGVDVTTKEPTKPKVKSHKKSQSGPKSSSTNLNDDDDEDDGLDIKIPLSLLMAGTSTGSNECTLLVQVTPEDAPALDFHGAGGAIGRFETSEDGVIMDLKGYQYQGRIQAGPTCIVASMHPMIGNNVIKVDCITDEFITLRKGRDQLAQLDGIIEQGDLNDSFQVKDFNINSSKGNMQDKNSSKNNSNANNKQNMRKNKSGNKKRKKPTKRGT